MSFHTDTTALNGRIVRLEAQLDVQQQKSASRIKELEQEVNRLEVDKRLSAAKPDGQGIQVAINTGFSDALRAEISQLQKKIAAKDAVIAVKDATIAAKDATIKQREEEASGLLRKIRATMATAIQDVDGVLMTKVIAEENEPREELTLGVPVTDTGKPAESFSASSPKRFQGDIRTRPHTPPIGSTPTNIPVESAPRKIDTLQPAHSQALRRPHEQPSLRRAKTDLTLAPSTFTHAELSAKRKAEQQDLFEPQKQRKFAGSNRALEPGLPIGRSSWRGRGGPIGRAAQMGRGDPRLSEASTLQDSSSKTQGLLIVSKDKLDATEVTVPANLEKRTGSEVMNAKEGMDQPQRKQDVDIPIVPSIVSSRQETLTDKNETVSNPIRTEAALVVPGPTTTTLPDFDSFSMRILTEEELFAFFGDPHRLKRDRLADIKPSFSAENGPQSTDATENPWFQGSKQSKPPSR